MEGITRIVKVLTVSGKLRDIMFRKLIKKYEKNKIVCTKYFYDIYLTLTKNNNIYNLSDYDIDFLENSNLNENEKLKILYYFNKTANIYSKDILKDSFLSIIRLYNNTKYKYLFLPFTLDYSIDKGLVHQCSMIIDLHNHYFLFYEPYGLYNKYGGNYAYAVLEFLNLYKFPNEFYTNGKLNYNTWHNYFNLETGIQNILLTTHNNMKDEFEKDKLKFLEKVKTQNLNIYKKIIKKLDYEKNEPIHKSDFTYDSCTILDIFLYNNYLDIEKDALNLYLKYNSKTCVTITITEFDYFFKKLANLDKIEQSEKLKQYYNNFKTDKNIFLFNRLDEFISENLDKNKLIDNSLYNIYSKLNNME
jgi:hypothetical protein